MVRASNKKWAYNHIDYEGIENIEWITYKKLALNVWFIYLVSSSISWTANHRSQRFCFRFGLKNIAHNHEQLSSRYKIKLVIIWNLIYFGSMLMLVYSEINRSLNQWDTRRVDSVKYCHTSFDSNESVEFTQIKLWNDDDLKIMFFIFGRYNLQGPIKLDAFLVNFCYDIRENLIRYNTYEEIKAYMNIPDEGFCLCLIMLLKFLCLMYVVVDIDLPAFF